MGRLYLNGKCQYNCPMGLMCALCTLSGNFIRA